MNAPEARDLTLGDINEIMKHKRAIIIGVVLKQESIAKLQPIVTKAKSLAVSKAEVLTLDNCFQAFVREEHLSGSDQWFCPKCKEHRDILKKLEIYKLPKVLILQLKRFCNKKSHNSGSSSYFQMAYSQIAGQEKIESKVDFPITNLDMRQYIVGPESKSPEPIFYDLYGISNHMGGLHGGHYTAYAYNHVHQSWMDYNDSYAGKTSVDNIVTKSAYILFYRRRD